MSFSKVTNPVLSEHETPDDNVEEKSENSEKLTKESTIAGSESNEKLTKESTIVEPESSEKLTKESTIADPESSEKLTKENTIVEPESSEKLTKEDTIVEPESGEKLSKENTIAEQESDEKLTKESATAELGVEDGDKDPVTESSETSNISTWQAVWSNEAQMYYYWNTVTNETRWEVPQEMYTAGSLYDGSMNNSSIASTDQAANTVTVDGVEYTQQEYYQYYAQYGYYPEGYYYGYDPTTYNTPTQTPSEPPNPLESILDKIDTEVKSKLDGNSSSSTSQKNNSLTQQKPSTTVTSTYNQDTQVEDSEYYSFLAQHGDGGDDYKLTARFNARTGKFQRDPTLTPEKFSADSKAIRQMSYFFDYDKFAEQRSKKTKLDDSGEIKENKKLNKKDIEFFKQKKKEKKEMKKKAWLMGGE